MTSEELREVARTETAQMQWKNDALFKAADTIERLQRENAEAERLLKRTSRFLQARELADGDLYADIDSHLSRTARHEGT